MTPGDAGLDAVVADALEICAVAAPTFAEGRRAALVARKLAAATGVAPATDAAGNVVARFGPADGPAAIVAAHLDTVFAAETPLEPTRDGSRLRGPGIGDDSLAVAALVHLARRLAAGPPPAHPVVLAATVGEEGLGDLRGARAVLDAIACDAFVALEGHGLDAIQVSGIGSARLIATASGPGGHSWSDRGRPSAVHALVEGLQRALATATAQDPRAHVNVGVIRGGTSINTIAAGAEAEIDLRDADDAVLERRVAAVEDALAASGLSVRRVGRRPAGATDPDHPLVAAARSARAAAGLRPAEEAASSTDANAAMGRGIPAVCVSLTHGAGAHTPDEFVDLAPLAGGLRAVELLVDALGAGLSAI
jgi:acetylornithine deacetylase/succinyl-diaminopimelate desuccinylase-like protein